MNTNHPKSFLSHFHLEIVLLSNLSLKKRSLFQFGSEINGLGSIVNDYNPLNYLESESQLCSFFGFELKLVFA